MRWSNCGSTICVVKVQLMNSPWADCSWEAEPDPGDPGLPSGLESHREMNHGLVEVEVDVSHWAYSKL